MSGQGAVMDKRNTLRNYRGQSKSGGNEEGIR